MIEGEIVDVVSEGVFEFVSDGHETDDDICCGDGSGDGNPSERIVELEGEKVDVEVDDLGNENVVTDGERSLENTFCGSGTIGEGVDATENLTQDDGRIESAVADGSFDVGVYVGEDFIGKISNGFAGSLDGFSGVASGETETEVFTSTLPRCSLLLDKSFRSSSRLSISIEMMGQSGDIGIMGIWFETKFMLESNSKGENEVDTGYFCEEIFFSHVTFTFLNVDPDESS